MSIGNIDRAFRLVEQYASRIRPDGWVGGVYVHVCVCVLSAIGGGGSQLRCVTLRYATLHCAALQGLRLVCE